MKGYIPIKRQEVVKQCYVWVGGEKPQIAIGSTSMMNEETSRTVAPTEIRKAFSFGGEQITFTEEETKAMKYFGDPGIRILGFKPMSLLPSWANLRVAQFIYPDEVDYIGSTRVFSALQQKLLKSQKFALVFFIARSNASPVLAAMIPGEEQVDEDGEQTMPPGLWLVTLPFADDIRKIPDVPQLRAPDPLVDKMKEIMGQIRLPKSEYDPRKYPNPGMSKKSICIMVR